MNLMKHQEWLLGLASTLTVWAIFLKQSEKPAQPFYEWRYEVVMTPIFAVFLFAAYAVTVVLYRVYTFNDCKEAAKELYKEIEMARADLAKKGFKF